MRTLYLDCFAGASGDMLLGALIELGVTVEALQAELAKLHLPGWRIAVRPVIRRGITATKVDVLLDTPFGERPADASFGEHPPDRPHQHHQPHQPHHHRPHPQDAGAGAPHTHAHAPHGHRSLSEIRRIVTESELHEHDKELALRIFQRLGEAEATVHGVPVEQVHFHEVGGVDAIIDIVGTCVALRLLRVERIVVSPLHVGSGFITIAHGRYPVPAPATLYLLVGAPVYGTDLAGELVTPTGAAIVTTLADAYGPFPAMTVERVGYGAGAQDRTVPNALRAVIGEADRQEVSYRSEETVVLESQVDDMNPELLGHAMDRLLASGALDVLFMPIQMKKNRPGTLVQVLCLPTAADRLLHILFAETTTLGVRKIPVTRYVLDREVRSVETVYGAIRVKIAQGPKGQVNIAPEYEDCRARAAAEGVPLKHVYIEALAAAWQRRDVTEGHRPITSAD